MLVQSKFEVCVGVYLEVGPNPCPFGSRPQVVKGCGAPNPCPFASREGLGGAALVHLQVVKGWRGGPQPLSICRPPPSHEGLGGPQPLSICKS